MNSKQYLSFENLVDFLFCGLSSQVQDGKDSAIRKAGGLRKAAEEMAKRFWSMFSKGHEIYVFTYPERDAISRILEKGEPFEDLPHIKVGLAKAV